MGCLKIRSKKRKFVFQKGLDTQGDGMWPPWLLLLDAAWQFKEFFFINTPAC